MPNLKSISNKVIKISCTIDNLDISKMGPVFPPSHSIIKPLYWVWKEFAFVEGKSYWSKFSRREKYERSVNLEQWTNIEREGERERGREGGSGECGWSTIPSTQRQMTPAGIAQNVDPVKCLRLFCIANMSCRFPFHQWPQHDPEVNKSTAGKRKHV